MYSTPWLSNRDGYQLSTSNLKKKKNQWGWKLFTKKKKKKKKAKKKDASEDVYSSSDQN